MTVTLPKRSVLDEFYAKRHRIIEEGNLYLAYIYSSLTRQPRKVYSFEELIEEFETLRVSEEAKEITLRGQRNKKDVRIIRTTHRNLLPCLYTVVSLFRAFKALELREKKVLKGNYF